jgi:hypothetical protein
MVYLARDGDPRACWVICPGAGRVIGALSWLWVLKLGELIVEQGILDFMRGKGLSRKSAQASCGMILLDLEYLVRDVVGVVRSYILKLVGQGEP